MKKITNEEIKRMKKMNKEIARKPNVLEIMASKHNLGNQTFLNTLRATVMKPDKTGRVATNEEVAAFLLVAHKYDLNPFTKEIYAFPDKRAGIVPIVSIDGFITIMNRHPDYDGYEMTYSDDSVTLDKAKSCPEWAEIRIFHKNRGKPTVVREYLDEVYQPPRGGYSGAWQTHTKRMLRHKTIIQGARVAFGLSGIYDEDEAERIVEATVVEESKMKPAVTMPQALPPETLPEQPTEQEQAMWDEEKAPPPAPVNGDLITEPQRKRLYAIGRKNHDEAEFKEIVKNCGYAHSKDIPKSDYERVVEEVS